ncbi:unnamed protein product [Durusdinium trenchii]|uniref:Uncharacterized protein n=2 Tax=Durusdinium trenchii TaxID=1381693 RepID=A0ABP0PUW3_9DINO
MTDSTEVFPARRGRTVLAVQEEELDAVIAKAEEEVTQDFDPQDYVRPGITEAEVREMKAAFDLLDADGAALNMKGTEQGRSLVHSRIDPVLGILRSTSCPAGQTQAVGEKPMARGLAAKPPRATKLPVKHGMVVGDFALASPC